MCFDGVTVTVYPFVYEIFLHVRKFSGAFEFQNNVDRFAGNKIGALSFLRVNDSTL
jgi:hypothetical protein